jgi:CRISPR-associated protein Cmr3
VKSYLIQPKAPLLFRLGRPFGAADWAETLPFPLPGTLAGALRGALGEQLGLDHAGQAAWRALLQIPVAGPLLVRRWLHGGRLEVCFPKPADAVYLPEEASGSEKVRTHRLRPRRPASREGTDLPREGTDLPKGLWPAELEEHASLKKPRPGPAFWSLSAMVSWLAGGFPADAPPEAEEMGVHALPQEVRAHVSMDPARQTRRRGQLFQTAGLDFGPRRLPRHKDGRPAGWEPCESALLMQFGRDDTEDIEPTLRTVGGRSRLSRIEHSPGLWPECPPRLVAALRRARGLRLTLASPAAFRHGWCPDWLTWQENEQDGGWRGSPPGLNWLVLRLRAAAMDRWQPASGWDMLGGAPRRALKPLKRLVPAGAVYWFEVVKGDPAEAAELWLAPVSDAEQDRQDGYGLVLPGAWDPDA